jgi:hypothetical protein
MADRGAVSQNSPCQTADDLRHQREGAVAGAAELQHVGTEVTGLDDGWQAAPLAQWRHVAGDGDAFKHARQAIANGVGGRRIVTAMAQVA